MIRNRTLSMWDCSVLQTTFGSGFLGQRSKCRLKSLPLVYAAFKRSTMILMESINFSNSTRISSGPLVFSLLVYSMTWITSSSRISDPLFFTKSRLNFGLVSWEIVLIWVVRWHMLRAFLLYLSVRWIDNFSKPVISLIFLSMLKL